jgi:P-type E1-E2 ATPase
LLEERAKQGTAASIRALMGLTPKTAHLVDGGTVTDIPISAVQPRDTLEVRPGEKIPVDGSVCGEAIATVDESMMTGEAVAIEKKAGGKQHKTSAVYLRLLAACEHLLAVAKRIEGRANKELARYADAIEKLAEKMEK